eukprot:4486059-Amphidinium_carterae.1
MFRVCEGGNAFAGAPGTRGGNWSLSDINDSCLHSLRLVLSFAHGMACHSSHQDAPPTESRWGA